MAALSSDNRCAVWAGLMSDLSNERQPIGITKADLRAAIDAVDDWVNANAASFNSAIPQPARASLTTEQKAQLLLAVVRKRFDTGA